MIEQYLIRHCSPTLANLKTANLFSVRYESLDKLGAYVEYWNGSLQEKGVTLTVLCANQGMALVYVYRKKKLQEDLGKPGVLSFMRHYGYDKADVDNALCTLKKRFVSCEQFPHEIGLFLGYPLGDVIGFIENAGKNSKCSGCWKVYCNECEALKLFAKFQKCKEVYERLFQNGCSIGQLTVRMI